MLNEEKIFSVAEHREYVNRSAMWITEYQEYLNRLERWFGEIGEELPLPCRTNYRDAWFHYRKIYEHRDSKKVIQEQYAMEEHLIRAIKDAINSYFQNYLLDMEIIYKALKNDGAEHKSVQEIQEMVDKYEFPLSMGKNWELELRKKTKDCGVENAFPKLVCYIYTNHLDKKWVAKKLQLSMHRIKNYCAKLRLNGTDIYRPISVEEYMEECQEVYNGMIDTLEELQLKNILNILAIEYQNNLV
jgi:hypothetical protein